MAKAYGLSRNSIHQCVVHIWGDKGRMSGLYDNRRTMKYRNIEHYKGILILRGKSSLGQNRND